MFAYRAGSNHDEYMGVWLGWEWSSGNGTNMQWIVHIRGGCDGVRIQDLMREQEWQIMKVILPCGVVMGLIYREKLERFGEAIYNRLEEDRVCWDEIVT